MKKIFLSLILATFILTLVSCVSLSEQESIEVVAIKTEYKTGAEFDYSNFILRTKKPGEDPVNVTVTKDLVDSGVVKIEGFDTSKQGTKFITITYKGLSVSVSYNITEQIPVDAIVITPSTELNNEIFESDKVIVFTEGIYNIESQIYIISKSNIQIIGIGEVIIQPSANFFPSTSGSSALLKFNSCTNIIVKNITFQNSRKTSERSYGHGVDIVSSTEVKLENIALLNNQASGLTVNTSSVTVSNIIVENNGWGGINLDSKTEGLSLLTLSGIIQMSGNGGGSIDLWADHPEHVNATTGKMVRVVYDLNLFSYTEIDGQIVWSLNN